MHFLLFVGVLCLFCITLCSFQFCNYLEEEERAGCSAFIVLRMSCYCKCFVALPHGAMGWSEVCDCGISRSYSLTFCVLENDTFFLLSIGSNQKTENRPDMTEKC